MTPQAEDGSVQLETRDTPDDAAGCQAGWEAVVAGAGLGGIYEVTVRQVRLPASRRYRGGGAHFTLGVFLRVRPGVSPGAAAEAAMRAAVRAGMTVSG
jgi:hypothetical protein